MAILSGPSIVNDLVAATIYGALGVVATMLFAHLSNSREVRPLLRILGTSEITRETVIITYPTIAANAPRGTHTRYRSVVKNLDSPYIIEGPDEVVAQQAVLGIYHVLGAGGGALRSAEFVPHSMFADPSLWPTKAIIAIGGPVANEIVWHTSTDINESPLRFDTTTHPWTVRVRGLSDTFFSDDRRVLDYAFIYRTRHPRDPSLYTVSIFGQGAPGTRPDVTSS